MVPPDFFIPLVNLNCSWEIVPPAGCRTALNFSEITYTVTGSNTLTVTDLGTRQTLLGPIDSGNMDRLPPVMASSVNGRLFVNFVAYNQSAD